MITLPRLILFGLAVFGDISVSLPKNRRQAWNFWFGAYDPLSQIFNRHSFTVTVSRMLKTRQIEKVIEKGKVKVKITPQGLKILGMSLDLEKFARRKWDGQWRQVIFDIEEKERDRRHYLRSKLRDLGFGMLQESVWISPFPLEAELFEFFEEGKVVGDVLVSVAKIQAGDQRKLAERVWKLDCLNDDYLELKHFWQYLRPEKKNKASAFEFQRRYFALLWSDPFLPRELLPNPWFADGVRPLYLKEVQPVISH